MPQTYFDAMDQLRDPQIYAMIGAAMEVHRELGRGFLEAAYCQAPKLEFVAREKSDPLSQSV